jgi:protocatechuate 3,4-dioxygenase beta subunit
MKNFLQWVLLLALPVCALAADGGATGRYSGAAVDDQGRPVAGATVECYVDPSPVAAYTAQDFALKERGATDSKGGFTVPVGGGVTIVVVKKDGLAPGWRTFASVLDQSSDPVVLTGVASPARSQVDADGHLISYSAPAPYALAGRVVDENGRPVADADVWVTLAMPIPKSGAPPPAVAPGADPVAALLTAIPPGGEFSQSSMIFGKPARDCFSARTAADGRFRIANFPGNTEAALAAHKSGMALVTRANANVGGRFIGNGFGLRFINNAAILHAPPPYIAGLQETLPTASWQHEIMPYTSGQLDITLPLEQAGNIEGKLTDQQTGQPLPGAKLLLLSSGMGLAGIETPEPVLSGPDGSFRMADVLPGMKTVIAVFSGEPGADWVAPTAAGGMVEPGETFKDLQLHAIKPEMAAITVLQRKDRQPLANVIVSASFASSAVTAVTGADGVARMRLWPGSCVVSASKEGWNDGQVTFNIRPDTTHQTTVFLDPHYRITGIVRDPSGAPVAGAVVSLNPGGDTMRVTTDANGRYEESWQVFAYGNQQSFALLARSAERHLAVNIPIDAGTTNLDLNLQPAVTLLAKVEDTAGKPVANAVANVAWRNGDRFGGLAGGAADAQGRIEIADMPPEDGYSISISAKGYGYGGGNVMSPLRQTNRLQFPTIVLRPANQKLAGKILYTDGAPVANVLLNCSGPNQPGGATYTDSDGSFSFNAVCEGDMQITIAQGSLGSVPARGGDTNVVLRVEQKKAPKGLNLTGTLRDPDGAPVAGAVITVWPNMRGNPDVKSDANGQYKIAWPVFDFKIYSYFLVARSAEKKLAALQKIDETASNLDLSLQPSITLSATVREASGKPVTNAVGTLSVLNGPNSGLVPEVSSNPDAQGRMEFPNMPQAIGYHLKVTAPGHADGYGQIQLQARQTDRVEFPPLVLQLASQELTGTIFDTNGKPAAGVRVKVWGDAPKVLGDNEKTGEVKTGPDGRYLIKWTKQNWGGTIWSPFIFARDLEHNLAASQDIDETTSNQDLTLQPGLTLSATVQDANGKPITTAEEEVTLWSGLAEFQFNTIPYRADDRGIIEITALPQGRRYSADITARGCGSAHPVAQIFDTQTNHFSFPTVVLKAADRKLAGQVLKADGTPVPSARVSIFVNAQSGMRSTDATTTDAQGRFSFDSVAGGTFQMIVNGQNAGYGSAQVRAGDTNVVFRLGIGAQPATTGAQPAAQMVTTSCTVLDPSGKPAPGVLLWMAPGIIATTNSKSDDAGKFTVSWLPARTTERMFVGRDLEHNLAGTVSIDQQTTNVVLHLQQALTISGSVQDSHGAPVKTATARLYITTPGMSALVPRLPATVDERGEFSFSVLPRGYAYRVNVSAPDFAPAVAQAGTSQTQTAGLRLPPIKLLAADCPLEGRVVGPDDKPVLGAFVRVTGEGQPATGAQTDAKGHFAMKVCEGKLRVVASVPPNTLGVQPFSGNIQAQAGDTNVVIKIAAPNAAGQSSTNRPATTP